MYAGRRYAAGRYCHLRTGAPHRRSLRATAVKNPHIADHVESEAIDRPALRNAERAHHLAMHPRPHTGSAGPARAPPGRMPDRSCPNESPTPPGNAAAEDRQQGKQTGYGQPSRKAARSVAASIPTGGPEAGNHRSFCTRSNRTSSIGMPIRPATMEPPVAVKCNASCSQC